MRAWTVVLAGAVGLSLAGPAAAQLPERGARSLRLSSSGDTQVGVWKMVSGRTALGLEAGVALGRESRDDEDRTTWGLTAAPSFKRYGAPVGPFAPYLFGSVPLGLERVGQPRGTTRTGWVVGGALAAGLDWFPVPRASVGAHAGVEARRESQSFDDGFVDEPGARSTVFRTFGTGLSLHIYF
ncbi:MAG TPA: hypothetical protein VF615_08025 [Longimicrobiaceae bacterium]